MNFIFRYRCHLINESPWPFLVSTASLFLTLSAVLFFNFFVQGLDDLSYCVVSFMSLASKAKPKVLYLGGSLLANKAYGYYQRNYSLRSFGIGNAKWNPDNYSIGTQIIVNDLKKFMDNGDKKSIYDTMYAVMGNKQGIFSQSFGKVSSVLNNLIFAYNKDNPDNKITEKEFLDHFGFNYADSDLNFLDKKTVGTVFTNVCEILAPQIPMSYNSDMLVERSLVVSDKINLSCQENPEYTIGIFLNDSSKSNIIIYDVDFKMSDDYSLIKKINDFIYTFSDKNTESLGINIFIVASHGNQNSEFIFNKEQTEILVKYIKFLSKKYPEHFQKLNENSEDFENFISTGKVNFLHKIKFPMLKIYRPNEFYKLHHKPEKFESTEVYRTIQKLNTQRETLIPSKNSVIIEALPDDINN